MKYILVTRTFQKQLKEFRRHFSEADIVTDIKEFIRTGGGKHTTFLKQQTIADINLSIAKLRLKVYQVDARYLIGITEGEREYIPIIIDLKTGKHGQNLGFNTKKKTQDAIETALEKTIAGDYIAYITGQDTSRMTVYVVDID